MYHPTTTSLHHTYHQATTTYRTSTGIQPWHHHVRSTKISCMRPPLNSGTDRRNCWTKLSTTKLARCAPHQRRMHGKIPTVEYRCQTAAQYLPVVEFLLGYAVRLHLAVDVVLTGPPLLLASRLGRRIKKKKLSYFRRRTKKPPIWRTP